MIRRNKYGVGSKEARTSDDGIVFDSIKEKNAYVNQFRPLMRSGVKVEMQKPFPLFACGGMAIGSVHNLFPVEVCKYVADFVVTEADGTVRIYDVKGYGKNAVYLLKKKWFEICYKHLRIVEL